MKAVQQHTEHNTQPKPMRIDRCRWGDLIIGTKAQLASLGFDSDITYPGEAGGPIRKLRITDPRGLSAVIEHYCAWKRETPAVYEVRVHFPGAPSRKDFWPTWVPLGTGVSKRECSWSDHYKGSGEALVAAGLMNVEDAPGPGGWRVRVARVAPDGRVYDGQKHSKCGVEFRQAGAKVITKLGQDLFNVQVILDRDLAMARHLPWEAAFRRAEELFEKLPKPRALERMRHLRLVWTSPK